jgi:formylglycine-generating enzyme required for sulfatase activity
MNEVKHRRYMTPKTITQGVLIGLSVGVLYIVADVAQRRDQAERDAEAAATAIASSKARAARARAAAEASSAPAARASASAAAPEKREGMVQVPGATYQAAFLTTPGEVKSFWLDVTEVTQKAYLACVEAKACPPTPVVRAGEKLTPHAESLPVTEVGWAEAGQFCKWSAKRLPTEIEWELAARGTEGRKYPWGDDAPGDQVCWRSSNGPCPVGATPKGDTPLGLKDMGGNVWEWVAEEKFCPNVDRPDTCEPSRRVGRGGAWNSFTPRSLEGAFRAPHSAPASYIGFRCASDA